MNQPQRVPPWQMPDDGNRIDINLIAMLLWQSLLTGVSVTVSHLDWYLPEASPAKSITIWFDCIWFPVCGYGIVSWGGIRDSLALGAEFAQEGRYDKWHRNQMRLQQRHEKGLPNATGY